MRVCEDFGAELREFNGEPGHVHLFVHYPPTFALSRLVNSLKCGSSLLLLQEYAGQINRARTAGHVWAPSYFAASAGGAPLSIIKEYIRGQQRPDRAGASSRP